MKAFSKTLFALLLLFNINTQTNAQTINLVVFEPLPIIDFAAFAVSNSLTGAPRIFGAIITPAGIEVEAEFRIEWQKIGAASWQEMVYFKTRPFLSRNIFNDDVGVADIRMEEITSNKSAIDENIALGRPTGRYRLLANLIIDGNVVSTDSKELSFINPTPTLSIMLPSIASFHDAGNVQAEWDNISGVSEYIVRANVRTNPGEDLEAALNSGNPLINNKSVNLSSVNLRTLLDREWSPGDEVVLQVTATIPGPAGGVQLRSNIVNFYINNPNAPLLTNMMNQLNLILSGIPGGANNPVLLGLLSGQLQFDKAEDENGNPISFSQLEALLNLLSSNPDLLIDVE